MKKYIYLLISLLAISEPYSPEVVAKAPCNFDVRKIAGKSQKEIEKLYGKPASGSTVNPSRTPCPCPKKIYLKGTLEIVYMRGKADWITINVDRSCSVNTGDYPAQRFDDYAYIKAFTR